MDSKSKICSCGASLSTSNKTGICRSCAAKNGHTRRQALDVFALPFIANPSNYRHLVASSSEKVPCLCNRCRQENTITFFSVFRQWKTHGEYICRSCRARENGALASKGLEKRKRTNLAKYGVEHPMMLPEMQKRNGCVERITAPDNHHKAMTVSLERYGLPYAIQHSSVRAKSAQTLAESQSKGSKWENEVRDYMQSISGQPFPSIYVPPGWQVDCANTDKYRLGIECNGLYWHQEKFCPRGRHYKKMIACAEIGMRLITLFEDEWRTRPDQVKAFLRASVGSFDRRIGARQCEVVTLDIAESKKYLESWHIQGSCRHFLSLGLIFNKEVLVVMTFSKHHRQNTSGVVLSRLVGKPGIQVVGGASRLLREAETRLAKNGHTRIVSWSDNRWSVGNVYDKMGFIRDADLPPDYSYIQGNKRISKQSCQKKHLLSRGAVGSTEREMAVSLGLHRIWDCGKIRWIKPLDRAIHTVGDVR